MNFLTDCKVTRISAGGAGSASATPTKATIIDMAGFDRVVFLAEMGNVLTTSEVALKVAGADVNDTAEMELLEGSAGGTAGASDYDDKVVLLDVIQPTQRYLEAQLFHVTADAPFDSILAVQYGARVRPVTQSSSVVASALLANPAPAA